MARSAFQPFLQGGGAAQVPQQPVQGVDLSGVAGVARNLMKNIFDDRAAEAEQQATQDLAALQGDLLSLHNKRSRGNLLEQQVTQEAMKLWQDGTISDNEFEDLQRVERKLDKLNQFRTQGLGNDEVFKLRKNTLLKNAIFENPALASQFNSLFNGDISDPSSSAQNIQQSLIISELDQRYGPGQWGTEEWSRFQKESAMIANKDRALALGAYSTAQIQSIASEKVDLAMSPFVDKVRTALGAGDVLKESERVGLREEFEERHTRARVSAREEIKKARTNGRLITADQERAIMDNVDSSFEFYNKQLFEGTDLKTRLQYLVDTKNLAIESSTPMILSKYKQLGPNASLGDLKAFFMTMSNDKVKGIATDFHPFLGHIEGDIEGAMAQVATWLINGTEIQDPAMRDIADVASASFIMNTPKGEGKDIPEGMRQQTIDALDRLKDAGNTEEYLDILNERDFADKLANDASPQARTALKVSTEQASARVISEAVDAITPRQERFIIREGRQETIELTQVDGQPTFVPVNAMGQEVDLQTNMATSGDPNVGVSPTILRSAMLLNKFLTLSSKPSMQGIAPNPQKIIDNFIKMSEQRMAQAQAREQEENEE